MIDVTRHEHARTLMSRTKWPLNSITCTSFALGVCVCFASLVRHFASVPVGQEHHPTRASVCIGRDGVLAGHTRNTNPQLGSSLRPHMHTRRSHTAPAKPPFCDDDDDDG